MMNLRAARFNHRLTQIELEAMTGVNQSRISLLESGYAKPTERERKRIEAVLGPINYSLPPSNSLLR